MKKVLGMFLAAVLLVAAAGPALADGGRGRDHGWERHRHHHGYNHWHHRGPGHHYGHFGFGFGTGFVTGLFLPPVYSPRCYDRVVGGYWAQGPVTDVYGYGTYPWQWVPASVQRVCF